MGIQAVFYPDSYTGLAPEETTLAEVLKSRGYATSYIGKWHVGSRERFLPLNQGFDSYLGIPYSNDMSAQVLLRGNDVEEFHIDIDNLTKKYTREAVQCIESSGKKPFFLMLGHSMMHVVPFTLRSHTHRHRESVQSRFSEGVTVQRCPFSGRNIRGWRRVDW